MQGGLRYILTSSQRERLIRFCTALTGAEKSPLHKAADVVLRTVSDETNYRILGLSSRIAQLAIIDAVYSYLVCHLPLAENKIAATEAALQNKKI